MPAPKPTPRRPPPAKRKPASAASRKAKGRRLQDWVRDQVRSLFSHLEPDDVTSRGMGQNGTDIVLSPAARKVFPYSVEAKNQEIFGTLYKFFDQAKSHGSLTPLLVVKMNHQKPLVVMDAEDWFALIASRHDTA